MLSIDHGIEYHVEFNKSFDFYPALSKYIATYKKQTYWDPDGLIVIAPTSATDQRLTGCRLYKENKDGWFNITRGKKRLLDKTFALTDEETAYLNFVLAEFGDAVTYHGWYEVVYYR
jgi:hypothetical protein